MDLPHVRPPVASGMSATVRLFGVVLSVAIVAGALFSILALRSKEIEDWRRNLRSMAFLLTEHTSQTVFSAFLVLDAITERVREVGARDQADFRARLSTPEMHQLLREKIQGLPQLDVAALVAANGDNINFSRAYPVPPINLAERDYFKAHRDNPHLGDHISQAVRNKGNGKWTFYVSRRLDDEQGRFLGLVLVGLSVDAFTGLYGRLVQSLGDGAAITLFRSDMTALARSPHRDDVIGKVNHAGSAHTVVMRMKEQEAVLLVDSPRFSTGEAGLRLSAVRQMDRYPLVLSLVVPDSIVLAGWRRTAWTIAGMSLLSLVFVLTGIRLITRSIRRREQTEAELRESEAKFHTMVDWAQDWEYWLRADGSLHCMTPSALRLTGYPVGDFERDPGLIDAIVHPEDRPRWAARARRVDGPAHRAEERRAALGPPRRPTGLRSRRQRPGPARHDA
jgi:hypothetical protein